MTQNIRQNKLRDLWTLFDFSIKNISERIKLQKTIFLLQKIGLDLRYQFIWYIYGPYSTTLAKDIFTIANQPITNTNSLNKNELRIIGNLKKRLLTKLKKTSDYELLADIIYLKNNRRLNKDEIFTELTNKHSYFNDRSNFERIWCLFERDF